MRSIEYVQWIIITVLSLVMVKLLYQRNWAPIEKMIFSGVASSVFFLLVGALWFSTGKKLDEVAYEAILCPFFSLSRCELSIGEREREEQAKLARVNLERMREERARLERERTRFEQEREDRARLEQEREDRAKLEQEREERAKLERERKERARLERERKERAKLEREREERARLEREREEQQRRSQRFAAMAVGNKGNRLFAVTARDMSSYADAEEKAIARCNQEVSNCHIEATFNGAGKCGYAAIGVVDAGLFDGPNGPPDVHTGSTETEAIEKCQIVFQKCYIFHTSCNSP